MLFYVDGSPVKQWEPTWKRGAEASVRPGGWRGGQDVGRQRRPFPGGRGDLACCVGVFRVKHFSDPSPPPTPNPPHPTPKYKHRQLKASLGEALEPAGFCLPLGQNSPCATVASFGVKKPTPLRCLVCLVISELTCIGSNLWKPRACTGPGECPTGGFLSGTDWGLTLSSSRLTWGLRPRSPLHVPSGQPCLLLVSVLSFF